MDVLLSPDALPNVASFLAIGLWALYLLRQVIVWLREDKSDLKKWETDTIASATEAGKFTLERFRLAREQLKDLEDDLKESKVREAELISGHRNEVSLLKSQHSEEVHRLNLKIDELEKKLEALGDSQ